MIIIYFIYIFRLKHCSLFFQIIDDEDSHVSDKENRSEISLLHETEADEAHFSDERSSTPTTSRKRHAGELLAPSNIPKRRKKSGVDDLVAEAATALKALSRQENKDEEDDASLFGKLVANGLRRISDLRVRELTKLQIQNLLYNAEFPDPYYRAPIFNQGQQQSSTVPDYQPIPPSCDPHFH